jgi:hypothetical protein
MVPQAFLDGLDLAPRAARWERNLSATDWSRGGVLVAGSAGLALAIVLGKRRGWGKDPVRPHNLPLVLLGAALLWFGWFGFNAGSELGVDGTTALAFMNTQIATAAAAGGWLLVLMAGGEAVFMRPHRARGRLGAMSSWNAAAQWLTVAGSALLVLGTYAQARASLIEYRDLFADMPQAGRAALEASKMSRLTVFKARGLAVVTPAAMAFITEIPRQLEQIRQEHGDAAARAAQLIRLVAVWSVLTAGAALILVATIIQLVLAYVG